jgi:hypothetical protein
MTSPLTSSTHTLADKRPLPTGIAPSDDDEGLSNVT